MLCFGQGGTRPDRNGGDKGARDDDDVGDGLDELSIARMCATLHRCGRNNARFL
jgi:hypothetical protein